MIELSFSSDKPLYLQIKDQVIQKILTGEYLPGDKLTPLRRLAKNQDISVITVKKAYEELAGEKYVYAVKGKGYIVSDEVDNIIQKQKEEVKSELCQTIKKAKFLEIDPGELWEIIIEEYKKDEGSDQDF